MLTESRRAGHVSSRAAGHAASISMPVYRLVSNPDLSLRRRHVAQTEGAATTVTVGGATITEADLLAGVFMGQAFSLAPSTTFDINAGGVIGPVGSPSDNNLSFLNFGFSTVNINNGGLTEGSSYTRNINLNVFEGGIVGDRFTSFQGSATISGGIVGDHFEAGENTVNITGGSVGRGFSSNGVVNLFSDLQISSEYFSIAQGDTHDPTPPGALGGVLADGSVFIFSSERDHIALGKAHFVPAPSTDTTPMFVTSGDATRKGLRAGQTLTISGEAQVRDNFEAIGGVINIEGGSVGAFLATVDTVVNISGGGVGSNFDVFRGSTVNITGGSVGSLNVSRAVEVNISGGTVGSNSRVFGDSTVNISGGSVGDSFVALNQSTVNITGGNVGDRFRVDIAGFDGVGGTVNISGGSVGDFFRVGFGSTANISGGTIGDSIRVTEGGALNLFVLDISIDGVALDIMFDETVMLTSGHGSLLEATLADGSFFDLTLDGSISSGMDQIDLNFGAVLTVTRVAGAAVPAPGAAAVFALAGLAGLRRRR